MATRKLGLSPLMRAIYDRLKAHALTTAYTIYGYAPRNAAFPFITIGFGMGVESAKFTTKDSEVEENSVAIHVWSNYLGDKECAEMMDNVIQAILGSDLSIVAYFAPLLAQLDYSEIIIDATDPDNLVRHGVMRFKFHMTPS
jgi:hypothetical protein